MSADKPSMVKIAKKADVSAMTVSRVLNGSPNVAAETRNRILRIASEMGYSHIPNAMSRILRGERSRSIGILTCFARPHLSGEVLKSIGDELFPTDYVTYIVDTYADPVVVLRSLQTLAERRTDGVIYFSHTPGDVNEEIIALLRKIGCFVIISHDDLPETLPGICCGWTPGIRHALEFFRRKGRRRPVLLKESANRSCVRAFEKACTELGFAERRVATLQAEEVFSAFAGEMPGDCLICSSEKYRIPVSELTDQGRKLPIVMLMDDFLISQVAPAYPVLRRREPEAGKMAAKILLDQMENGRPVSGTLRLPMEFIENIGWKNSFQAKGQ